MASNSAEQVSTILYTGTMPQSFLAARMAISSFPVNDAIVASANPMYLASFIRAGVMGSDLSLSSIFTMLAILRTKKLSQQVSSATFSTVHPFLRASAMANMRLSVAWRNSSASSSSVIPTGSRWMLPISRDLTPLRMASSNVRPMAMVSPVDFIWVPRCLSTVRNLSKGHLGTFRTT